MPCIWYMRFGFIPIGIPMVFIGIFIDMPLIISCPWPGLGDEVGDGIGEEPF